MSSEEFRIGIVDAVNNPNPVVKFAIVSTLCSLFDNAERVDAETRKMLSSLISKIEIVKL